MNKTKLNSKTLGAIVTPAKFQNWLKRQVGKPDVNFVPGSTSNCPIASYLKSVTDSDKVTVCGYITAGGTTTQMPKWANSFISIVDSHIRKGFGVKIKSRISPEEALDALFFSTKL